MKISSYILALLLMFSGCSEQERPKDNGAFSLQHRVPQTNFDFDQIQSTGELIVVTMSGPESYYEYQGRKKGLQYAFVQHFAQNNGLRVRIEVAHHMAEMIEILKNQEADLIGFQLPVDTILQYDLVAAGVRNDSLRTSWAVRSDCPLLRTVLEEWSSKGFVVTIEKTVTEDLRHRRQVSKKVQTPYLSKSKGIISRYDDYFKSAARMVGWDWRLLAAQCYQESGFDPDAVSWAGAQGLMQIMPAAAEHLKLPMSQVFNPRENVAAAACYLEEIDRSLSDIKDSGERVKFVLAAYNGGLGHIRDARALARKYGRIDQLWSEVAPFVLKLSEERYFRDEVVKHGYMVGSETCNYVDDIMKRWKEYQKNIRN